MKVLYADEFCSVLPVLGTVIAIAQLTGYEEKVNAFALKHFEKWFKERPLCNKFEPTLLVLVKLIPVVGGAALLIVYVVRNIFAGDKEPKNTASEKKPEVKVEKPKKEIEQEVKTSQLETQLALVRNNSWSYEEKEASIIKFVESNKEDLDQIARVVGEYAKFHAGRIKDVLKMISEVKKDKTGSIFGDVKIYQTLVEKVVNSDFMSRGEKEVFIEGLFAFDQKNEGFIRYEMFGAGQTVIGSYFKSHPEEAKKFLEKVAIEGLIDHKELCALLPVPLETAYPTKDLLADFFGKIRDRKKFFQFMDYMLCVRFLSILLYRKMNDVIQDQTPEFARNFSENVLDPRLFGAFSPEQRKQFDFDKGAEFCEAKLKRIINLEPLDGAHVDHISDLKSEPLDPLNEKNNFWLWANEVGEYLGISVMREGSNSTERISQIITKEGVALFNPMQMYSILLRFDDIQAPEELYLRFQGDDPQGSFSVDDFFSLYQARMVPDMGSANEQQPVEE